MAVVLVALWPFSARAGEPVDPLVRPLRAGAEAPTVRSIDLRGWGGQENWSSIAVTPNGDVLLGLSSRSASAVLLSIDPDTDRATREADLDRTGRLLPQERQPKIHVNPIRGFDGGYYFVTHFGLETHLALHGSRLGYDGMRLWRWRSGRGSDEPAQAEHLGRLMEGEGAVAMAGSHDGKRLFVVTFPQGKLVEIDSVTSRLSDYGRCNGVYAPRQILVDPQGQPYVLDHSAQLWRGDQATRTLMPTGAYLPDVSPGTESAVKIPGNLLAQGWVASCGSEDRRRWYATSAWGRLYRIAFDLEGHVEIADLGSPADRALNLVSPRPLRRQATIAGLALAADDQLYLAVSGYNRAVDASGDCYILRCRTDGTDAEAVAALDGTQVSYICGSGATDPGAGRVYFVASHLTQDHPALIVVETGKEEGP